MVEVSAGAHEHSGEGGDQEGHGGGSRLRAVGRVVVRGAVAVGLAAALTGAVAGLGRASMWVVYAWAPYRPVLFIVVIVAVVMLIIVMTALRADTRLSGLSFAVFMTGWLFFEGCCMFMAGQQALHDRGEPVPVVVVDVSRNGQGSSTLAEVQLADGTRHAKVQVGDEHPRPGDRTTVTLDPEGLAQPRLGPPPGPPDTTRRNIALAVTAVGAAGLGTHFAGRPGLVLFRPPRPPEDTPPPGYRRRPGRPGRPGRRLWKP